jgi:hypothetical protein
MVTVVFIIDNENNYISFKLKHIFEYIFEYIMSFMCINLKKIYTLNIRPIKSKGTGEGDMRPGVGG